MEDNSPMRKNIQVTSSMEYPIQEAFERLSQKLDISQSAHIRRLIIQALKEHDMLPPEMAVALLAN